MKYKLFPITYNGDQVRVTFEYDEERQAFSSVLEQLWTFVSDKREQNNTVFDGFEFLSTLEMEVARDHYNLLMEIVGLWLFNISSLKCVRIKILPLKK